MSDGSLVFRAPALQPGQSPDLVFGLDTAVPLPPATLTISARLPGLRVSGYLRGGVRLEIAARMPGMRASVALAWDANVSRSTTHQVQGFWQAGTPVRATTSARWQNAARTRIETKTRWQTGQPLRAEAAQHWQESAHLRAATTARWQQGRPLRAVTAMQWQETVHLRVAAATQWQDGVPLRGVARTEWQESIHLRGTASTAWQEARHVQTSAREHAGAGQPLRIALATAWQIARKPPIGVSNVVPIVPPAHLCYDPETIADLVFRDAWTGSADLIFICRGHHGPGPEPGATVIIPIRSYYVVYNNVTFHRADSGVELIASSCSMQVDDQSWTWSLSASFEISALQHLETAIDDDPVELLAEFNSVVYAFLVESVGSDRSHANERVNVSARGLGAMLDAPHAPVQNFGNPDDARTAEQLMTGVLTLNGVGIGWDLDFRLDDWLVPADVWMHQGTYMSALNEIAAAGGGYIQPHPTNRTLRVLPRYPTVPWEWSAISPDYQLPIDVTVRESIERVSRARYTGVYVSGTKQGVLRLVRRAGTSGAVLAPMVTDALNTHDTAARQRGISILGNTGRQALVSLSLPVLPETGVIVPGKFVSYVDGGTSRIGIVRSTSVAWSRPKLRQTVQIETHV